MPTDTSEKGREALIVAQMTGVPPAPHVNNGMGEEPEPFVGLHKWILGNPQHRREAAEIGPVPTSGGGGKPEPELDRLSNILKTFNDQFGGIDWRDADRMRRMITQDIPEKVAADTAYQNAKQNSDKQDARIEHDKALARVIIGLMKDDTELFKQYSDNPEFKRWPADTVFGITYEQSPSR